MLIELFNNVIEGKINNVKPDLITFNTFIKGCAQLNLYDKVTKAFDTLMKTDIKPNDVTFNTLIDVFVRQKKMDQVWTIISNMKKYGIKPDNFTYSTVIKGLDKNCIKFHLVWNFF
jgi:pentatricopeptide repeat protein